MARKKNTGTPIAEHEHADDSRLNIPTVEQQEALVEDEQAPPPAVFRRNPALDPQLVWKGKYPDENHTGEGATLEVSSLPIYIQEVVRPVALLEDLRADGDADGQMDLFASRRRKLSDDQRFDFYRHEEDWQNRLIQGDSLLVMTSLAEREGLRGKIQMIYVDPPYGVRFRSNWQTSTRDPKVPDEADFASKEPEQIRAFRDTWRLGINSYLSYLRDRLLAAHALLTDSGSVFVQIGDENVHRVRSVLDEVFGPENFVVEIVLKKKGATSPTEAVNDYILWYCRDRAQVLVKPQYFKRDSPDDDAKMNTLISPAGDMRRVSDLTADEIRSLLASGYEWARVNWPIVSQDPGPRSKPYIYRGREKSCGSNGHWRYDPDSQMVRLELAGRLFDGGGASLGGVVKWGDWPFSIRSNLWDDLHGEQETLYVVQTNRKAIERCMLMTTSPGDLVLDPTCGSGTTAVSCEQWGRRWITVDTSRVALAIARRRLASADFPFYLLRDSVEGRQKSPANDEAPSPPQNDLRQGFVCDQARMISLGDIARNQQIDEIQERFKPELDLTLGELAGKIGKPLKEWEVAREFPTSWPASAADAHARWWTLVDRRYVAITESIQARAESKSLEESPVSDPKRVRVTGPFTVESLSPHRVLPAGGDQPDSEREGQAKRGDSRFVETVITHLRKAGVQNGDRKQRLEFERLDPFPGQWIHAMGEGKGGLRVAVCVGPQFGTVGKALIDEARKEAEADKSVGVLVVCGMAFEPTLARDTSKDQDDGGFALTAAEKRPRIEVFPVRISPDLALADRLKNTGAGNLFMVFGEPELKVEKQADGRYTVTLLGIDVYDPGSGIVRSGSADGDHKEDVACWMLDTAYDGRCFVVRHLYFPGKKDPYERLKKALKAEINPTAWESLRGTTSRPFVRPPSGTIAVKVINHYGDEVLKVWRLA